MIDINLNSLNELKKISLEFFKDKKNLLADEYDHLVGLSVYDINNKFPSLNIFFDFEGRGFISLMPEKPSKYMNSLYSKNIEDNKEINEINNIYHNLSIKYNKNISIKNTLSIFQSPFIIPSYYVSGNDALIKKFFLSEKLKGLKYISLYKNIDTNLLEFILNSYNRWYLPNVFFYYSLNQVHLVFDIPDGINNTSLAIEIGKLAKNYIINKYNILYNSYKIPDMNIKKPVLMVLKTEATNLKIIDINSIKNEIFNKVNESYKYLINIFK
ncbi:DUF4895 domain-containing protein [Marinitoga sp. 38H-ov]|uniref:DUF4895 domain-containing protein n=1 Tax=Marinitoga sp. 38H-ov TaxID=1755814 RepID=UPI0013EB2A57|nr:DUF4895 domain-containing protein [Marinitoga sp. 38H-ov]KAF2955490.1 hypothetical protein AS160_09840 [Marinitoga sp. 38H-ov]